MLEFMTMAVLLLVGGMGGAIIGGVYVLRRKVEPDAWGVVQEWDGGALEVFSLRSEALAYVADEKNKGNADAHAWVVRGVVLVREEGDPR